MSNPIKFDSAQPVLTFAASAQATYNSADLGGDMFKGLVVVVDITSVSGGSTLTVKVQGKDVASGKYYDLPGATTTALGATATTPLIIYPGIAATANSMVNTTLPNTFRIVGTVGTATLTAATVGVSYLI